MEVMYASRNGGQGRNGPSIAFIDIDYFKDTNTALSETIADAVLEAVFERVHDELREVKVNGHLLKEGDLFRWGGEEFVVLLPVPIVEMKGFAERIRLSFEENPLSVVVQFDNQELAERASEAILARMENNPEGTRHCGVDSHSLEVKSRRGRRSILRFSITKLISIGVASYRDGDTAQSLGQRANDGKSDAKGTREAPRRNCVVVVD